MKNFKKRQLITLIGAAAYFVLPDFLPGPVDDAIVGVIAAVLELVWAVQAWKAEKNTNADINRNSK